MRTSEKYRGQSKKFKMWESQLLEGGEVTVGHVPDTLTFSNQISKQQFLCADKPYFSSSNCKRGLSSTKRFY